MQTDQLIQAIAKDRRATTPGLGWRLTLAGLGAVAAAALVFFATLGLRPDFARAFEAIRFVFKFIVTIALAGGSIVAFLSLARPGAPVGPALVALIVAPLLALCAVALEMLALPRGLWAERWIGTNMVVCLTFIPIIGLAPLAIFMWAMRQGAPTRPRLAGAVVGLLSGGVAATFYAAHCPDDSPMFVATWYTLAVFFLAALGGFLGSRLLRW